MDDDGDDDFIECNMAIRRLGEDGEGICAHLKQ